MKVYSEEKRRDKTKGKSEKKRNPDPLGVIVYTYKVNRAVATRRQDNVAKTDMAVRITVGFDVKMLNSG
jgi:hypothetical protein